jgi:transcriptional regulator of acetoin/glycerol metabolism
VDHETGVWPGNVRELRNRLERCAVFGGNVAAASRESGVNRAYLYRMLRRQGLR